MGGPAEELLLQLAGHLRGHALQEWNFMDDRENKALSCPRFLSHGSEGR